MKTMYACEKCGKLFDNMDSAWECESNHAEPCTWVRDEFDKSFEEYRKRVQYNVADSFVSEFEYSEGQTIPKALTVFLYRRVGEGIEKLEGYRFTSKSQIPVTVIESDKQTTEN